MSRSSRRLVRAAGVKQSWSFPLRSSWGPSMAARSRGRWSGSHRPGPLPPRLCRAGRAHPGAQVGPALRRDPTPGPTHRRRHPWDFPVAGAAPRSPPDVSSTNPSVFFLDGRAGLWAFSRGSLSSGEKVCGQLQTPHPSPQSCLTFST